MAPGIYLYFKTSLLHMPFEIIMAILVEWSMLEWFAPAIARRICRYVKQVTDISSYVWSKLCLLKNSHATAHDVRKWLKRAGAVSTEIRLETEDFRIALATLRGVENATSLIYQAPGSEGLLPFEHELICLPIHMPRLRRLRLDTHNFSSTMNLSFILRVSNSSLDVRFPCLTVLLLHFVDLTGFPFLPGLFPVLRRLVLRAFQGPSLNLIRMCSGSLEDLRVTIRIGGELSPHDRICLPNLKVLMVDEAHGIVSKIETPTLRLILADLSEINGSTRPFGSVVEWATRRWPTRFLQRDITPYLVNMPHLRRLMLFQHTGTLKPCFELLRDNPEICPNLQSIKIVEFVDSDLDLDLDTDFMDFLKTCVEWRAKTVSGFTLEFVEDCVQEKRLAQYYDIGVCLFIVLHYYLSHHASR